MTAESGAESRFSGFANRRACWIYWLGFAAGLGWCLWQMLVGRGWILDDELSHYLISASVWQHPEHLWQGWTRPGRNLFHVLPAAWGLLPTRLWTLAWSALGVWWLTRFAQRAGLRSTHWLALLIWFQPWFVELSWPVLTQGPFFVAIALGLLLQQRGRLVGASLCFGYLATVRHEGIALTALWGLIASARPGGVLNGLWVSGLRRGEKVAWGRAFGRDLVLALACLAPLILLNLGSKLALGTMPVEQLFEPKPEGMEEIYGRGSLTHFVPMVLFLGGLPLCGLAVIGLRRSWKLRAGLALPVLLGAAWFLLHTLIYWQGLFASGGYYHFLQPVLAPALALLGVAGLDQLAGRDWWRRLARGAALGLTLVSGLLLLHRQASFHPSGWSVGQLQFPGPVLAPQPFERSLQQAAAWIQAEKPEAVVRCSHVVLPLELGQRLPWNVYGTPEQVAALPPGGLFVFEPKYAEEHYGVSEELLREEGLVPLRDFGNGVVVWEKLAAPAQK